MTQPPLAISPDLTSSLRARLLSLSPFRQMARGLTHLKPSLFPYVCGAHAGIVSFQLEGVDFKYGLGANDPIGDYLYWCGTHSWDHDVLSTFVQEARQARGVIFDVGANCGLFTILAALVNPDNRVIAWEPLPDIHPRLTLNTRINGLENRVELRTTAVGATSGQALFHRHPDPTMSGLSGGTNTLASFPVAIETLDQTGYQNVKLAKIDVEGHEIGVLQGMEQILDRDHPVLLLECLEAPKWGPIEELLRRHGYNIRQINSGNYLAAPRT